MVQANGGQSVGVGVVKCGEGVGEVWPSPPTHTPATTTSHPHTHYTLTLLTPAAAPLDNTENVTGEFTYGVLMILMMITIIKVVFKTMRKTYPYL